MREKAPKNILRLLSLKYLLLEIEGIFSILNSVHRIFVPIEALIYY